MIRHHLSPGGDRRPPVQRIGNAMQVCLHLGAQRCATTSFQEYLRQNATELATAGIESWGRTRTRKGLFHGILPTPAVGGRDAQQKRVYGRLRMHLDRARQQGTKHLIVSEPSFLGDCRSNLRDGILYGAAGERLARFGAAFGGQITSIALNIRSLETYWASVLCYAVARGTPVPSASRLQQLAENRHSWRDVITDIACAIPDVPIHVMPFETFGGRPELQLSLLTGQNTPMNHARVRLNASLRLQDLRRELAPNSSSQLPDGEGRWRPFDETQTAQLRESYADDLMWLAGGADGLAQLVLDPEQQAAGLNLPQTDDTRGTPDDKQDRRLAGSG